jgi:hypothetical protein
MEEEEEETDPTESTVLQIKFIAYSVIAYIIVGVGIVGNLLNLVVLTRPNLKGVMYVYLLGLAVSNLCVLLSAVPALFDIAGGGLAGAGAYPTAFYQAHLELPLINSFMASSVYIIICMTVNRYISIYRPTHFQRVHTHKNARISIAASFLGGIVLHVPLCFQNRVDAYDCILTNRTTTVGPAAAVPSFSLQAVLHLYDELHGDSNDTSQDQLSNSTTTTTARVVTTTIVSCQWRSDENFLVSETYLFKVYLILSEILLRVGPILILGILNTLIISKFTKIAKKRHLLKSGAGGAGGAGGGYPIKPEASSMIQHSQSYAGQHSTPSSPFPSRNTSSTNQSSSASSSGPSTSCSSSSGPRLLVPGGAGAGGGGMLTPVCSRSPSPEPSSVGSADGSPAHEPHMHSSPATKIRRRRHRRHKNRSLQSPEERMLVVVLISIVVLFVCCTTPAAVLSILYTAKLNRHLGFQIFRAVANNLELLNFALNFYIYCLCSAEIRRAFVQVGTGLWRAFSCAGRRNCGCRKSAEVPSTQRRSAVTVRVEQV